MDPSISRRTRNMTLWASRRCCATSDAGPQTTRQAVFLPQIITGSHDKTVKMWDLRKGKTMSTLTYHKKSIRAMASHPQDFAFAAASADNIKKYRLPQVHHVDLW
jgi:WD40 repeat protein